MKKFIIIIALLLFLNGCTGKVIQDLKLEGPYKVVNVVDGDTLDLNNSKRVRLSGINTPEVGECYYSEAKNKLASLTLEKEVYIEKDITNIDKYGRLLRYIYINNAIVNSILVEEGYAKVYDKYKNDTKRYSQLKEAEEIAIKNSLGVWSCEDAIQDCLYVRSKNSDVYHKPECRSAKRIKPENIICYETEEELNEDPADLRPAKVC